MQAFEIGSSVLSFRRRIFFAFAICLVLRLSFGELSAQQQTLILDNGFAIGPGILRAQPRLDRKGFAGSNEAQSAARIAVIDDGLRMTYVSTKRADRQPVETPIPFKITLKVNSDEVCRNDAVIQGGLGSAYSATPFSYTHLTLPNNSKVVMPVVLSRMTQQIAIYTRY